MWSTGLLSPWMVRSLDGTKFSGLCPSGTPTSSRCLVASKGRLLLPVDRELLDVRLLAEIAAGHADLKRYFLCFSDQVQHFRVLCPLGGVQDQGKRQSDCQA